MMTILIMELMMLMTLMMTIWLPLLLCTLVVCRSSIIIYLLCIFVNKIVAEIKVKATEEVLNEQHKYAWVCGCLWWIKINHSN